VEARGGGGGGGRRREVRRIPDCGGKGGRARAGKGAGDRRLTDEDGEDEEVDTEADAEANIWVEIRRQDGAGMTRRW